MTKGRESMYWIAYAKAVEHGPRVLTLNDGRKASVYCLSRSELKTEVFAPNQFNTNGKTWLDYINSWKENKGDRAPSKAVIMSPTSSDWAYVFLDVDKDDLVDLKMFAENNNAPSLTNETRQTVLGAYA